MDTATQFIELAREDLSILDFSACFFRLAARKNFNDETLKSLYWTGANYYSLSDLPDMSEGTWRKVILRCLVLMATTELETAVRPASDPEPTPNPAAETRAWGYICPGAKSSRQAWPVVCADFNIRAGGKWRRAGRGWQPPSIDSNQPKAFLATGPVQLITAGLTQLNDCYAVDNTHPAYNTPPLPFLSLVGPSTPTSLAPFSPSAPWKKFVWRWRSWRS